MVVRRGSTVFSFRALAPDPTDCLGGWVEANPEQMRQALLFSGHDEFEIELFELDITLPCSLDNRRGLKFVFKELVGYKRHWFVIFKLFEGFLGEDYLSNNDNSTKYVTDTSNCEPSEDV